MLCQNCKKNEATTHIKQIVNGETTQAHLCSQCAQKLGYDSFFDDFSLSIPNIFSSFFGDTALALNGARAQECEKCKSTFEDIIRTGMVGCADCYEKFFDKLLPSIQRIHGKAHHCGKIPNKTCRPAEEAAPPAEKSTGEKIEELEAQMKKAIETQNFEQAAVLRDNIKSLREGM